MKPPVEAPTSRQSRPATSIAERLERVLQLGATAGDVARPRVDDQARVRLDQLARPQRHRPVGADPNFARPHRPGRGRARREQALLRQNRVYPGLLHPPKRYSEAR